MGGKTLILGPPGTGKTTTLMGIIRELLSNGYEPAQIGFVSYSRASVAEARDRVAKATGIEEKRWTWFRTLHSAYGRLLGTQKTDYLTAADMAQFDGFSLTERAEDADDGYELPTAVTDRKRDDELRAALDWTRSRMVPAAVGVSRLRDPRHADRYRRFAVAYPAFRNRLAKFDHTDILEGALAQRIEIPVRVLIVDEAQDLSPLQAACVELSFPACDRVYVAGDDDQAIYEFQGSSPDWLIDLSRRDAWETRVLGRSWRCPEAVRSRAERIALRLSKRAAKTYAPREGDGEYRREVAAGDAVAAIHAAEGSVFVLCRTKRTCGQWGSRLRAAGIPYAIERGGHSPFGDKGLRGAIDIMQALHDGQPVQASRLAWLAGSPWAPSSTKADQGVLVRGAKSRIKAIAASNALRMIDPQDPEDVADCGLDDVVRYDPWQLLGMVRRWGSEVGDVRTDLRLLRSVWDGLGGAWPERLPTITTWHASKGREADLVVIDPSLAWPQVVALGEPDQADPEHRCAYVALTRARHTALIVEGDPDARGHYPFPA